MSFESVLFLLSVPSFHYAADATIFQGMSLFLDPNKPENNSSLLSSCHLSLIKEQHVQQVSHFSRGKIL